MTRKGKVVLVGGGVRSGKSRFALALAHRLGQRRAFVATAQAFDAEMAERIDRHRRERGTDFETVEEPLKIGDALHRLRAFDVVLVDCLTLWLSNLLIEASADQKNDQIKGRVIGAVDRLVASLGDFPFDLVVVSNEVGMGIVPDSPLGRMFRDVAGYTHQRIAGCADEIYFAALGVMMRLRPGPVTTVEERYA
ncbi:MAG: bifunctional adenosylcobinamide kinase/adenosylcobinamide-phosphate guanylyltransferase [Proteobacteria bacterium]|nr:bifunctional adenosylcobinamide kinase/adenosylcobinamide-phosphate guanylyltransferase [Pseudomonadota bacterium]